MTAIVVLLTTVAGIVTKIKERNEELRQSAVQASRDVISSLSSTRDTSEEYIERIQKLKEKLDDGSASSLELYDAQKELLDIQDELTSKFGKQAEAINLIGDSAEKSAEKLREMARESEHAAAGDYLQDKNNKKQYTKAIKEMEEQRSYGSTISFGLSGDWDKEYAAAVEEIASKYSAISATRIVPPNFGLGEDIEEFGISINGNAQDVLDQVNAFYDDLYNTIVNGQRLLNVSFNNEYGNAETLAGVLSTARDDAKGIVDDYASMYQAFILATIAFSDEYSDAMYGFEDASDRFAEAMSFSGDVTERNQMISDAIKDLESYQDLINNMTFAPGDERIKQYMMHVVSEMQGEIDKQKLRIQFETTVTDNPLIKQQVAKSIGAFVAPDGVTYRSNLEIALTDMDAGAFDGYTDEQAEAYQYLTELTDLYDMSVEELINSFVELNYVFDDIASRGAEVAAPLTAFEEAANNFRTSADGELSKVVSEIDKVTSSLTELANMQDTIGEKFRVTADQALEYAKVYPEILEGAQLTADGEIQLNEDVVNAFIDGKEAELKSGIDTQIATLEAERQTVLGRMQLAQAELEIIEAAKNKELGLDEEKAVQLINIANQVLNKEIEANGESYKSYVEAAKAMVGTANSLGVNIAEVATKSARNVGNASYDAAAVGTGNMSTLNSNIFAVGQTANQTARAIAGIGSGSVVSAAKATIVKPSQARSSGGGMVRVADTGTGGGQSYRAALSSSLSKLYNTYTFTGGSFTPEGFSGAPVTLSLGDLASNLSASIESDTRALAELDGQIAVLQALRNKTLKDFKAASGSSGGGGSGGGGSGSSAADDLEDALELEREVLRDFLNDIEHEIEMRSFFDNESKNISELYKKAIAEVEKEIAHARELGLADTDDYIQELQKKWVDYTESLKKLQDDVRDNAKDAVDDLVKIRVDMLKKEISDQKEALNKQLDMLKDFYDKQKDLLQDQYDEEKYLEEQAEKRRAVSKIQEELSRLEYDNSAWAQKRKLELAQELADAQKELDDFEKDHALETAQDELDRLYEMQEKAINDQIDLLEQKEDDEKSLYAQALEDIRNGSVDLYNEMIDWNEKYGDGIKTTITDAWEEAYKALEEYKTLYDDTYEGVNLSNATGYQPENGPYEGSKIYGSGSGSSGSGASSGTGSSSGSSKAVTPADEKKSTPAAPALAVGTAVSVKSGTKWYADSYGGGRSGTARGGKIKYINLNGTHPYNIDGLGWVKKTDIVGYAAGTRSAIPGIHSVDERGDEYIFQSSDGSRYRLFNGGEKVLNARATNFLYDFANNGSQILQKLMNAVTGTGLGAIRPVQNNVQLVTGDIIINGNTDKETVSEIRRAQRDAVDLVLRQFNKLNK